VPWEVKVASTHSYEVPNPYNYLTSVGHKRDAKQTSFSFLKSVKTFSTSWIGKITYTKMYFKYIYFILKIYSLKTNVCIYYIIINQGKLILF